MEEKLQLSIKLKLDLTRSRMKDGSLTHGMGKGEGEDIETGRLRERKLIKAAGRLLIIVKLDCQYCSQKGVASEYVICSEVRSNPVGGLKRRAA